MGRFFRRALVLFAVAVAVLISVGGGGTYVLMQVTTRPQFCRSCHNMVPYYESWATSSHNNVSCVDCHYEPGLLETFEGKFKALSQLAKYVTATEGTKPWAEVSDYSCMRSGCHSERLLEGEIQFGRIRFDHRHHLIGLERGKKLRCTSCHSQIVQGSHVTVTPTSCFLCHFKESKYGKPLNDCNICHGPPADAIDLGGFVFKHSDYLKRGVKCASCHGDVTRGTGDVPRERCGSCHNKQAHLDRYGDVEFMHKNHVTDHSVNCLECHMEIQHGLPPREQHFRGQCTNCHQGTHTAPADVYQGSGGVGVENEPSAMYLARVTCNGCHREPFPGAPVPVGGATFKADPLACIDCHGPGFEGMAQRWQAEARGTLEKAKKALGELHEALSEEWEDGDPGVAKQCYDDAARNVSLALLEGSDGVHNLPYTRDLLRKASEQIGAGFRALDPGARPPTIQVGPRVPAQDGCTTLCHVGVEEMKLDRARDLPFPHATHLLKAKLDCSRCHAKEPHGTTLVQKADCVSCHHKNEDPETCGGCHGEIARFRAEEPEGIEAASMASLDCLSCHIEPSGKEPLRTRVMAACDECHEDDGPNFAAEFFDDWKAEKAEPLKKVEARLKNAPPEVAAEVRRELDALYRIGPFHNAAAAEAAAKRLAARLDAAK